MNYTVVIPDPIVDKIVSWGLSLEAEEQLYQRLEDDLREGHKDKCSCLAAPSPTFVYSLELQDPAIRGLMHSYTFWLTYGELESRLYVRECDHEQDECWDS